MMVHLHVNERINKYMEGDGKGIRIKEAAKSLYQNKILFETTSNELTILKRTGTVESIKPIMTNLFLIFVFFMIFLSIILNQSLVQSVRLII